VDQTVRGIVMEVMGLALTSEDLKTMDLGRVILVVLRGATEVLAGSVAIPIRLPSFPLPHSFHM